MAGSLPTSGVKLVAEGVGAFLSDIGRAGAAVTGFGDHANRAGGRVSGFGQVVTGALREVGAIATQALAEGARAVAGFVAGSVTAAGDFEQTINVLGATSGATAEELEAVSARAKELGADLTLPTTSANEAAEVMLELSKAGMSVQEAMDAAKGSLQLATAAQVDGATAAGIMSGALNAFELEATDAVRVADLLAAGANASSASMTDLGQGLQQAGFAFHTAQMPVEDLVTSLAALTNVGLTGSDAGTALKNALMRLMNPTKKAAAEMEHFGFAAYDAAGNMKSLPQIIGDLNIAMAGMTKQEQDAFLGTVFLSDGMKAMIPLLALGTDGFLELKGAVTEQGAAAAVAEAQTRGWTGATAAVTSQLENLQLVIGEKLLPILTPFVFKLAEIIGQFSVFIDRAAALVPVVASAEQPFRALIAALTVLMPFMGGTLGLVLRLVDALAPMITKLLEAPPGAAGFAVALAGLLEPLDVTAGAIMTGMEALQRIGAAFIVVADTILGPFTGGVGGGTAVLGTLITAILTGVLPALAQAATWLAVNLPGALATLSGFIFGTAIPAISAVVGWFQANLPAAIAVGQAAFQNIAAFIGTIMPAIQGIITSVLTIIQAFWQQHGATLISYAQSMWTAIQGVIQVVLGVIQAAVALFLGLLTGDWETAGAQLNSATETIWLGIQNIIKGLLGAIQAAISVALGTIVSIWSGAFSGLAALATEYMNKAKEGIVSTLSAIAGAFAGIVGAINGAISAVRNFISAASQVRVPNLITPGSPTPLEVGLRGIDKAASQAARTFQASFSPALAAMPAMPNMAGGQSSQVTTSTTYTMPIYTNQSPSVLRQSLAVVEALAV